MDDETIFEDIIFADDAEGAVHVLWEVASRCTCFSIDSRQPGWDCTTCGGLGAAYAAGVQVRALFRGQSRWTSHRMSGEHGLGSAQLTTPVDVKPAYTDERVRDRLTIIDAPGDSAPGRVFYPAAQPVPFIVGGVQRAWRVQVQAMDNKLTRARPQP